MRAFDPVALGRAETLAWTAYYRRRWDLVLRGALRMVHVGFGMGAPRTVRGAWLVLRANRRWAPYPHNDPTRARELMREFYALVADVHGGDADPDVAASLEVEWWRVHRVLQRERPGDDPTPLVDALTALYAYVYAQTDAQVRPAAALRAEAMRVSDRWVADGADPASPAVAELSTLLVRGYAALLTAVHR